MTDNRRILLAAAFCLFAGTALLRGNLSSPNGDLTFSHALHVGELTIECMACHGQVTGSARADDRNLPGHDECAVCHEDAIEGDRCGTCHMRPEAIAPPPALAREIIFSHKDHLARQLDCADCHPDVSKTVRLSGENMPDMERCVTCHDGRKTPFDCSLCHSDPSGVKRRSHPAGWLRDHKYRAPRDDSSCKTCHPDTDYCQDCHEGDNLQQTSHPVNYAFTHTLDAKGKEKDCLVCHTNQSFCNDCHEREEVMPMNHSSASWPGRDHGIEAARDMEACAGCHDEEDPTCLRCHRDLDSIQGTDPSPHGPGYAERGQGPWCDDPTYLCFRCHRPGAPFQESGFCRYCHDPFDGEHIILPSPGGPIDAH